MRYLLTSLRLLIFAAAICSAIPATAQPGLTSEGREFWLGFMPNADLPAEAVHLQVVTKEQNNVIVEVYGQNGSIVSKQTLQLAANTAKRVELNVDQAETRIQETPRYQAIRITSELPCSVYGISDNSLSTGAYMALPIEVLGNEYYCFSYVDDRYWFIEGSHFGGEFLVVAPYDDTRVTIRTTAQTTLSADGKTLGHDSGSTWTVTLARGQTYLVQSTGHNFAVQDLTGSRIISDKPIAFVSGHQRAQVGVQDTENPKDHMLEMLPPTNHWGTEYFGVPHANRPVAGTYFRVMSADDDNIVMINSDLIGLDAGEYVSVTATTDAKRFVSTNGKRLLVVAYQYSRDQPNSSDGDAFMMTLTPRSGFINRAEFAPAITVGSGSTHRFVFISSQDGLESIALTKGSESARPLADFDPIYSAIPSTDLVGATIRIPGGQVWSMSGSVSFSVEHFGVSTTDGFGCPVAMSFGNIASVAFDASEWSDLRLWPNPGASRVNIKCDPAEIITAIHAIDVLGKETLLKHLQTPAGWVVDVSILPIGCYTLCCLTPMGTLTNQLVIKR